MEEAKTPGAFLKSIVQSVLLFIYETWLVTSYLLWALWGFRNRVARHLTDKHPLRQLDGRWVYPPIVEAMEAAVLGPVE